MWFGFNPLTPIEASISFLFTVKFTTSSTSQFIKINEMCTKDKIITRILMIKQVLSTSIVTIIFKPMRGTVPVNPGAYRVKTEIVQ